MKTLTNTLLIIYLLNIGMCLINFVFELINGPISYAALTWLSATFAWWAAYTAVSRYMKMRDFLIFISEALEDGRISLIENKKED